MRNRRKNWMLKRIALAFAVVAVAAPTAQAVPLEPGATKAEIPRGNTAPHGVVADIKAGDYGMPRAMPADYAVARGNEQPLTVSTPSFNWSDAGIGAGLAFAAILLAGAGALSVRQYGRLGQV
jgi:hypothetical protein